MGNPLSKWRNHSNVLGCNFKRHLLSTADAENLKKHVEVVKLVGSHGPFENKTLQAKVFFDDAPCKPIIYEVIFGLKSKPTVYTTRSLDQAVQMYNNF